MAAIAEHTIRFPSSEPALEELSFEAVQLMRWTIIRLPACAFACAIILFLVPTTARAQHGDWILGSNGLEGGSQAPEGLYYQNLWSYYHASGSDFSAIGPLKCGPFDKACLSLNVGGSGNLDLFVDQNILG